MRYEWIINQLEARREENNISKRELARRCGLHRNTVQRIFTGETVPSVETIQRMAQALEMDFRLRRRLAE